MHTYHTYTYTRKTGKEKEMPYGVCFHDKTNYLLIKRQNNIKAGVLRFL